MDSHPANQLVEAARFWAKLTKTDMPGEPWHPRRIFNYYCVHLKQTAQPAFILDISPIGIKSSPPFAAIKVNSSKAAPRSHPPSSINFATKQPISAKP